MSRSFILEDDDKPVNRPLTRFRPVFSLRNGIYTPLERLRLRHPDASLYFRHPDAGYRALAAQYETLLPAAPPLGPEDNPTAEVQGYPTPRDAETITTDGLTPFELLDGIGDMIAADLELLRAAPAGGDFRSGTQLQSSEFVEDCRAMFHGFAPTLVGDADAFFIHRDARILPGVVLDGRDGPVVIDAGVQIGPSSYIAGPFYAGPEARLDNLHASGGCILGRHVRAGGEIGNAVMNDFSNKHHEGFLGHSVLGRWVNLGALTTTSDLKNNYGRIRIKVAEEFRPTGTEPRLLDVDTGRIKFGSVIGDCVKTAIGTMLNTGTVLDAGSNVFGGSPPAYLPPLRWGVKDPSSTYKPDRFLDDCRLIFARRGEAPGPTLAGFVAGLTSNHS